MPTVWISTKADSELLETFRSANWQIRHSSLIPEGPASANDLDVVIFKVGRGALSTTFRSYCEAQIAPVLALAADWEVAWQAIEAGANDVLIMPFDPAELLFRARKLVWAARVIRVDDLVIDLAAARVRQGNRLVCLTPLEFQVLACLARHIGEVVTFDQILDEVWACKPECGGTREQVKTSVKRLRRKLDSDLGRPRFIITVRSVGYRLRSQDQWEDNL